MNYCVTAAPPHVNERVVNIIIQAMWLMLQRESPEDFVVATGETHSVRELVELAFSEIGVEIT